MPNDIWLLVWVSPVRFNKGHILYSSQYIWNSVCYKHEKGCMHWHKELNQAQVKLRMSIIPVDIILWAITRIIDFD